MHKIAILPSFVGPDRGDGGIRRVVEAQRKHLPQFGWEVVDNIADADLVATHAANQVDLPASVPLVSHCHGLYWYGYDWGRWALRMNRDVIKSMRRADVVTAPSEWVAQAIRRGSQIAAKVLYHGVDINEWAPGLEAQHDGYVLWNKTRVDPICDPTPVYELARRAPKTNFWSTLEAPGVDKPLNVSIIGVSPFGEAKAAVQRAAVYLATTRETFGIGTVEAMASGVPVLGWDWGGQHEIVRHLHDGYLAKVDDYDDLARGLEWCLANRHDVSTNAQITARTYYTWEYAMSKYAKVYDAAWADSMIRELPLVSVVMPCYNMERYIEDAIKSVAGQAFKSWELVVVDDASTDDSMRIVNEYARADDRIRIIRNDTNQYLAEALNVGIRSAMGRYVVPLDPDNMLGDGALGLLASALERDRDIDIAYGAMSLIEPNGREWTSGWPNQTADFRRQLIHQNQVPSTSMYRRRVWERVGGYRRRCRTAEDADFWCRAMSFGANARKVTDAVTLRYRDRTDSMSHTVPDWPWEEWYPWGRETSLTPWIAPIPDEQREDPVIPTYETPLVSVVIPVGPGHARFVLDALDSLNAQTFRWWEAIVVNDTGADLLDIPVWARVINTRPGGRMGSGAARNMGMALARGRMFAFLDADDYFQPRALDFMVGVLASAKGGFVYTDWFVQETGEPHQAPEWDGCNSVLRQLPWPVTCLYPIGAWAATGGFDETLPAWEDWDFAIRVVEAGYCGTRVAAPLFHYRMDAGSRREAGFADRESLKEKILERWAPYITGEKTMPCGCAGGGGLPSLPAIDLSTYNTGQSILPPMIEGVTADQMVLLEFTETVSSPITFTGRTTGTRYRFGSDDDNRVRYVYRSDADYFLTGGSFVVYNQVDGSAPLAAAGPPR